MKLNFGAELYKIKFESFEIKFFVNHFVNM